MALITSHYNEHNNGGKNLKCCENHPNRAQTHKVSELCRENGADERAPRRAAGRLPLAAHAAPARYEEESTRRRPCRLRGRARAWFWIQTCFLPLFSLRADPEPQGHKAPRRMPGLMPRRCFSSAEFSWRVSLVYSFHVNFRLSESVSKKKKKPKNLRTYFLLI